LGGTGLREREPGDEDRDDCGEHRRIPTWRHFSTTASKTLGTMLYARGGRTRRIERCPDVAIEVSESVEIPGSDEDAGRILRRVRVLGCHLAGGHEIEERSLGPTDE
jgi:hypothetical protein